MSIHFRGNLHLIRVLFRIKLFFALSAAVFAAASGDAVEDAVAAAESPARLLLKISGIESADGSIIIAIWNDAEAWLKSEPLAGRRIDAKPGTVEITVEGLEAGSYAVSVFHDINDNQELDTNFLGIPTEPIGFSNNVRNRFGPARFSQASFSMGGEEVVQRIELWHLQASQQIGDGRRQSRANGSAPQ